MVSGMAKSLLLAGVDLIVYDQHKTSQIDMCGLAHALPNRLPLWLHKLKIFLCLPLAPEVGLRYLDPTVLPKVPKRAR